MTRIADWAVSDAAGMIVRPSPDDDKYSRGVMGVVTGSNEFPGAAVLGVSAALAAGVGMVRFRGPRRAADLVLAACPEAVPAAGRVQAWLIGSGMSDISGKLAVDGLPDDVSASVSSDRVPTVLDAGALDLSTSGPTVITPHHGELARITGRQRADVAADPERAALAVARDRGVVVLLKGNRTVVAAPSGLLLRCPPATPWLATAGTGDALAGVLGALVTTNSSRLGESPVALDTLAEIAASAAVVHALAAERASSGGPITVRRLIECVSAVVAELLS